MSKATPAATAQFIQRSVYKSLRELPALPDAVAKVVEETGRPEPSAVKIERYVATDQALASKVLRVVNSAYYGLSGQVSNLGQAVMILGMQQVRNLVLSMGALSVFEAKISNQKQALNRFWLHSFAAAAVTQILCRDKKLDRASSEHAFVAGLLHDLGKLFLYANFTTAYEQLVDRAIASKISVEAAECTLLGIGHPEVGQIMGEFWKLPPTICEAIGIHEGPFDGTEAPIAYCVHIGDALSKGLYYRDAERPQLWIDPVARMWLSYSEAEFARLLEEVETKTVEAKELFRQIAA